MKTLIIGGSSKIGKILIKEKINFISTYNKNKIKRGIKFDLEKNNILRLIKKYNINKIILLSAISDPDACKKNKKKSNNINIFYTKKFIDQIKDKNIYLMFISSEYVYSGKDKKYNEDSKTLPKTLYGKQKLEIELYIKKKLINYSILRLCKTYGDKLEVKGILSDIFNEILLGKKLFFGATDQIFNPLYVNDLKKIILYFVKNKTQGTFNVGGPKTYSRFKIYYMVKKNISKKITINKTSIDKINFYEKRPKNLTMNVERLKNNINFQLTNIEDVIKKMIKLIL